VNKIVLLGLVALSLSGCASLGSIQDKVESTVLKACDNKDMISIGLNLALTQAMSIQDQDVRDRVERSIHATQFALAACP